MYSFSYSIEEGKNIVVPDSLLTGAPPPGSSSKDLDHMYMDFKRLCEKDIRLQWHIITLSDYWREQRIPRGLRIKKFPSFGLENVVFREKWEAILNKCSFDLILLIIEQTKKEKENVQARMNELKTQMTQASNASQQSSFEDELKTSLEKFTMELKEYKLKKFRRDERDYIEGNIYQWKEFTKQQPRKRMVSFNLSTSEEEFDATQDNTSASFLGARSRKTTKSHQQKGQPRRRKLGGGEIEQNPIISKGSLRSQTRNQR